MNPQTIYISVAIPRARVIRKVAKMGKDSRPKVARDRRENIQVERVTAQASRPCSRFDCKRKTIDPGEKYAKLLTPTSQTRYVRGRLIRMPEDYHFDCVPPEAKPLLRFFKDESS